MNPLKIVAVEPGSANIYDRTTGEHLGIVIQGFDGKWTVYGMNGRGTVGRARYRARAAALLRHDSPKHDDEPGRDRDHHDDRQDDEHDEHGQMTHTATVPPADSLRRNDPTR